MDKLQKLELVWAQLQQEVEDLRAELQAEKAKQQQRPRRTSRRWEDREKKQILDEVEQARETGQMLMDVFAKHKITSTHIHNWKKQLGED